MAFVFGTFEKKKPVEYYENSMIIFSRKLAFKHGRTDILFKTITVSKPPRPYNSYIITNTGL